MGENRQVDNEKCVEKSRLDELKEQETNLKNRRKVLKNCFYKLVMVLIAAVLVVPILLLFFDSYLLSVICPASYIIMSLSLLPLARAYLVDAERELQKIEFYIDMLESEMNPRERHAEKMFFKSNQQLTSYYDLNINQNYWVFSLGVFCILIGVGVIGLTFYMMLRDGTGVDTKIIIGSVGAIGSILSAYIASVYLKIHSSSARHLESFHSRLVETHQQFIKFLIASRIEDKSKREETLAQQICIIPKHETTQSK